MSTQLKQFQVLARMGLRLPAVTLKRFRSAGILYQPSVSIMYQQHAPSYVLRAVESGGAIAELGAYCGFVDADGKPLSWSERVDNLAVNGLHVIVIEPVLVRLQMVRNRLSYQLLITRHSLSSVAQRQRPQLQSSIIFHGYARAMAVDKYAESPGKLRPAFANGTGEAVEIPTQFRAAVQLLISAVWCVGCRHSHLSQAEDRSRKGDWTDAV